MVSTVWWVETMLQGHPPSAFATCPVVFTRGILVAHPLLIHFVTILSLTFSLLGLTVFMVLHLTVLT